MRRRILLLAVVLAAALGAVLARPAPIESVDQDQPRLNQAAPMPSGEALLAQTFRAGRNGLSAVEVLAVVYGQAGGLRLRLLDDAGAVAAEQVFDGVAHNTPLRLSFAPHPNSAGRAYTLQIGAAGAGGATVWAYSLDGYGRGALAFEVQPAAGDLRFSTHYTYLPRDMLADGARALGRLAGIGPQLWLLLFAPGLLLLDLTGAAHLFGPGRWARWGAALALSLALLALVWMWVSAVGLRLSPVALWFGSGTLAGLLAWRWLSRWRGPARPGVPRLPRVSGHDAAMLALLLAGLLARLLAARDLALPAWVDSPHHVLIARLLAESGRVPESYAPLLAVDSFYYHFGVHAAAASLHWLTRLALPDVFLLLGQLLNGLMPLAAYSLAAALTGRPRAGLMAAFVVALVSFFPGYYLTWGRYSQLAGLLLMGPAVAGVWRWVEMRPLYLTTAFSLAVLSAGLLLTHYRAFFFFVVFAAAALALNALRGAAWRRLTLVGVAGALLAAPWLARLAARALLPMLAVPGGLAGPEAYSAFPTAYFQGALERAWLGAALVGLAWGLLRRERGMWLLALGAAGVFAALNLGPRTWLVNNNAWAISLFLPAAAALGWGADRWLAGARRLADSGAAPPPAVGPGAGVVGPGAGAVEPGAGGAGWRRAARLSLAAAMLGLLAAGGGWAAAGGLRAQIAVVNPATVLSTADDVQALAWARDNSPPEAVYLVNGWEWLNGIWAVPDGGAWLLPLADRRATLPPIDYAYGTAEQQAGIVSLARQAMALEGADSPQALSLLRAAGVTHVFIGARGGPLRPEMFAASANYRLMFTNGAAWVFEVVE